MKDPISLIVSIFLFLVLFGICKLFGLNYLNDSNIASAILISSGAYLAFVAYIQVR